MTSKQLLYSCNDHFHLYSLSAVHSCYLYVIFIIYTSCHSLHITSSPGRLKWQINDYRFSSSLFYFFLLFFGADKQHRNFGEWTTGHLLHLHYTSLDFRERTIIKKKPFSKYYTCALVIERSLMPCLHETHLPGVN